MASRLGWDVWYGNFTAWIDRHNRSGFVDDELASLLDLGPAHWSVGLGAPRRFDPAGSRTDDDILRRAEHTLSLECHDALFSWICPDFWFVFTIQPCNRWHAHAKYFLRKTS